MKDQYGNERRTSTISFKPENSDMKNDLYRKISFLDAMKAHLISTTISTHGYPVEPEMNTTNIGVVTMDELATLATKVHKSKKEPNPWARLFAQKLIEDEEILKANKKTMNTLLKNNMIFSKNKNKNKNAMKAMKAPKALKAMKAMKAKK